MGTSAKVLAPVDVRRFQARVGRGRYALRDRTIVHLSFKAGLRACEIAGLDWSMVLTPDRRMSASLMIADGIAKNGRGRRLPMHPELKTALVRLHGHSGHPSFGPVILSQRGGHMTPRSIVNWFHIIYGTLGLDGCSSHSGRRTFITRSARAIGKIGGSLRDVQELAGHRALQTTQRYIECDRDAQRKLIGLI